MRTHTLTKIFNTLLVFLALGLFYFSFNKLFLQHSKDRINLSDLVGRISHYQKIVQHKRADSIAWNFLSPNNENLVSEDDSIFTHEKSKATIALKNEQEITVDSQSLIRIKTADTVIVQDGKIEIDIKANQPDLTIQLGNNQYKLKANKDSSLSIQKGLNQSTFNVKSGEVKLVTTKKDLKLKAGTSTQIKNKKVEVTEIATQLISPKDRIILEKKQELAFAYKSSQTIKQIYIEREDRVFTLPPGETINLRAGHYKWGVIYKDEPKPIILQDFTLIKLLPAPQLITPPMHSSLQIKDGKVLFQWKSDTAILFELLNKEHQIIYSNIVKEGTKEEVTLKESGTYFWRVKLDDDLKQSDYSIENEFYISQLKEIKSFNTVEIRRPNQLVNIEFDLQESQEKPEFILSKTKDFKEILLQQKITSPTMSFKATTPGFYYWKVLDNKGNIELKKMLIIPSPPPTRAPKVKTIIKTIKKRTSLLIKVLDFFISSAHAAQADEVEITWEKIEDAKEYEIEIINNLKAKKVISTLTSQSEKINWTPPKQRNYYYRVRYKDFWDRFSPYSPYAQIKIKVIKINPLENRSKKKKTKVAQKPKPKPMARPEPKLVTPLVPVITKPHYEVGLFYSFSLVDFTQELENNTHDVTISGANISGHALNFKTFDIFKSSYDLLLNYKSRYGKVFNDEQFHQRQIQIAASKSIHSFDLSFGLEALDLSLYQQGTNQIIFEKNSFNFALTLGLAYTQKVGENLTFSPFFQLHKLTYQQLQFGLNTRYHWFENYIVMISLLGELTQFEEGDRDIESQLYQALTGLLYQF